jgi:two-component system sensor histidine kinase YesM
VWHGRHPKSLKNRLLLSFIMISIIPTVAISFFYYKSSQNTLEKNMTDAAENTLNYSLTLVEKQLNQAEQLSDWIFINRDLDKILTNRELGKGLSYNPKVNNFLYLVDYQLRFSTSFNNYIYSLIIHGNNGLDLRAGWPEGTLIDLTALEKKEWFQKSLALHGQKFWYGVVANPSTAKFEAYILPLVRPIKHSMTTHEIGWHLIGFRTALVADLFKDYRLQPDETLLVMDSRGYCIYHQKSRYIGKNIKQLPYIAALPQRKTLGSFAAKINGVPRLVVYAKSRATGWCIVKILSTLELNRQKQLILRISLIIFGSGLLLTSLFSVYLSTNLSRPFQKLLRQTKKIATGNFECDPGLEGEDELGRLGRGINEMTANIQRLLDRVVADEREKRQLELAVLQNQVNPHFLYNTLNSVKLMATLQKADGISTMVSALGRLLLNLSKNTAEKVSLAEELALLNDYIYIQNIRYKGKIKVDYRLPDEGCLQFPIVKFTLQPIVENAIFHGIEPKKNAGRIMIAITATADQLEIVIEDDGVGMTPAQIESLLARASTEKTRGLSKIGIKNVDERLKMAYGLQYGLTIESVVGEYTRVYVRFPKESNHELPESGEA